VTSKGCMLNFQYWYFVSVRTSQVQESSDDVTKTVPCPHKVLYLSTVTLPLEHMLVITAIH